MGKSSTTPVKQYEKRKPTMHQTKISPVSKKKYHRLAKGHKNRSLGWSKYVVLLGFLFRFAGKNLPQLLDGNLTQSGNLGVIFLQQFGSRKGRQKLQKKSLLSYVMSSFSTSETWPYSGHSVAIVETLRTRYTVTIEWLSRYNEVLYPNISQPISWKGEPITLVVARR